MKCIRHIYRGEAQRFFHRIELLLHAKTMYLKYNPAARHVADTYFEGDVLKQIERWLIGHKFSHLIGVNLFVKFLLLARKSKSKTLIDLDAKHCPVHYEDGYTYLEVLGYKLRLRAGQTASNVDRLKLKIDRSGSATITYHHRGKEKTLTYAYPHGEDLTLSVFEKIDLFYDRLDVGLGLDDVMELFNYAAYAYYDDYDTPVALNTYQIAVGINEEFALDFSDRTLFTLINCYAELIAKWPKSHVQEHLRKFMPVHQLLGLPAGMRIIPLDRLGVLDADRYVYHFHDDFYRSGQPATDLPVPKEIFTGISGGVSDRRNGSSPILVLGIA